MRVVRSILVVLVLAATHACGSVKEDCSPSVAGPCHLVTQCGCDSGEWCTWFPSTTLCEPVQQCSGLEPGTVPVGGACSLDDPCVPGAVCNPPGVSTSDTCLEWCQTDEDCSEPDTTCTLETTTFDIPDCPEPVSLPYGLCTLAE